MHGSRSPRSGKEHPVAVRRASFERWSTTFGGFALGGAFYYSTLFAVTDRVRSGIFEAAIREVAEGHGDAPFQYRFLIPDVLVWLADHTSLSLEQTTIALDGLAIAGGAVLGVLLLRR